MQKFVIIVSYKKLGYNFFFQENGDKFETIFKEKNRLKKFLILLIILSERLTQIKRISNFTYQKSQPKFYNLRRIEMILIDQIQDIPFFRHALQHIDLKTFQNLLSTCWRKHLSTGTILFRQGDQAQQVFLLQKGQVIFFVCFNNPSGTVQHQINRAKQHQIFGQLAACSVSHKRTASAITSIFSKLIAMPVKTYLQLLSPAKQPQPAAHQRINFPLLQLLSRNERLRFCKSAQKRVFHYNQKVYRQGEEPCEVFYVLSGEFRRVDARARHLEYYEMGCLFGEEEIMVLVDGAAAAGGGGKGRRNSSVLCNSTEAVAYSIPRQLFQECFVRNWTVFQEMQRFRRNKQELKRPYLKKLRLVQSEPKLPPKKHRVPTLPDFTETPFFEEARRRHQFIQHLRAFSCKAAGSGPKHRHYKTDDLPQPWFSQRTKTPKTRLKKLSTTAISTSRFDAFQQKIMSGLGLTRKKHIKI